MKATNAHLAALVLLLAVALPVVATSADGDGVIASEAYEGDGYVTWEVEAQAGTEIEFRGTTFSENASMEAVGLWVLDEDLGLEYAAILIHFFGPGNLLSLSAGPVGPIAPMTDGGSTGDGFLGITSFQVPEDGTYHVVALGAADGENHGSLSLVGPGSATVTGLSTGEAFLAKPPSFQGTGASVAAETPQPNYVGAQARLLMDATYPVDVEDHLFALFSGSTNSGELEMSVDTPDGTMEGRTSYFLHGEQAGEYTFRVDENLDTWDSEGVDCQLYEGGGICTQPTIYALGADALLP